MAVQRYTQNAVGTQEKHHVSMTLPLTPKMLVSFSDARLSKKKKKKKCISHINLYFKL